jgi:hypothetical protein
MAEELDLKALFREVDLEVPEHAEQMTGSQKLCLGADLFDEVCRRALVILKKLHPDWTHEQAWEKLRRRIDEERAEDDDCH